MEKSSPAVKKIFPFSNGSRPDACRPFVNYRSFACILHPCGRYRGIALLSWNYPQRKGTAFYASMLSNLSQARGTLPQGLPAVGGISGAAGASATAAEGLSEVLRRALRASDPAVPDPLPHPVVAAAKRQGAAALCRFYARFRLARSSPLVMAVSGATVTRPKEPTMVWTISAATYL